MRKKIALIGSTGSIGRQVINVALRYPERFEIVAMAANTDDITFSRQISSVRPAFACMRDENAAKRVEAPRGTLVKGGETAFSEACGYAGADVVFNAVTGFAGLKVALDAIAAGKRLALANKESLVVGGALVMPAAKAKGTEIVPVDSEHSAIWQCLRFDRAAKFSKLILTASGGALRDVPLERLPFVTAKEALAHPNWDMGAKITIDCATMLNKGFEVIEAMWLYGAPADKIDVVLHRESVVHSMVAFEDGAVLAQMSAPSMELPIQLALTYPERLSCALPTPDFAKLGALRFETVDEARYPCFTVAKECAREGGSLPCVLNAAGEIAVRAFLGGQIKYTKIAQILEGTLFRFAREEVSDYAQLLETDERARAIANQLIAEG